MSQTIPYGPDAPPDPTGLLTKCHYAFAIPAGDTLVSTIFASTICRRIYCNLGGTLYVKGSGDAVFVSYTVFAGQYLDGDWVAIGGTGTGSTSMTVNLEL